jgi:hypothetical protein
MTCHRSIFGAGCLIGLLGLTLAWTPAHAAAQQVFAPRASKEAGEVPEASKQKLAELDQKLVPVQTELADLRALAQAKLATPDDLKRLAELEATLQTLLAERAKLVGQGQAGVQAKATPVPKPAGNLIAGGGFDGTLKVWDAQTGKELLTLKGYTGVVNSVCFSPDGKRIAAGISDGTVKVWDVQTGQQALTIEGHSGAVLSVCFSPDGKHIASGSGDGTVRVCDLQTGQEILSLGHPPWVYSVCFTPDGGRIASGSSDRTVKVWDAQTGEQILSFKGHLQGVTSVSFSPN